MATTTMQLETGLRDELADIAKNDFSGVPLAEALRRLIKEHRINKIMARYADLQADPDEWAAYHADARLTDNAAADGLPSTGNEYTACPLPAMSIRSTTGERTSAGTMAGLAGGLRDSDRT